MLYSGGYLQNTVLPVPGTGSFAIIDPHWFKSETGPGISPNWGSGSEPRIQNNADPCGPYPSQTKASNKSWLFMKKNSPVLLEGSGAKNKPTYVGSRYNSIYSRLENKSKCSLPKVFFAHPDLHASMPTVIARIRQQLGISIRIRIWRHR